MNRYIAKVIDNNNTAKDGRIQIYIEHMHHDLNKNTYPWAKQDRQFSSFIPEIDDLVWVYFLEEKFHRQAYYQNKVTLAEYHQHSETIGSISGQYPNIKYIKLKNGCSIALNSEENEISIFHPNAEIYLNNDGEIHIKGGDTSIESSILGETLQGKLEELIDAITAITVGTGVGPSSTPINSATFTSIKSSLSEILSPKVKNN